MMNLYSTYKKRKYAYGSFLPTPDQEEQQQEQSKDYSGLAAGAGMVAGVGNALFDNGKGDPITGRKSIGNYAGKGALSGAAAGASLGPVGMAAGAIIGGGLGLLQGNKARKEARSALHEDMRNRTTVEGDMSAARLSADPSLYEGYKNSGYFAMGGPLTEDPTKPQVYTTPVAVEKANLFAKDFSARRNYVNPGDARVADKVGDPVVQFRDLSTNKPYDGRYSKIPSSMIKPLPDDIKELQWSSEWNQPYYKDGDTMNYVDTKWWNHPRFTTSRAQQQQVFDARTTGQPMAQKAMGGAMKFASDGYRKEMGGNMTAPLASMFMQGGKAKSLSSDTAQFVGPSHANGGIMIPGMGSEVEGGETTKDSFVFSKKLGFADAHKPIAVAKGKIEKKPLTAERFNAMKRLNAREKELAEKQEQLKQQLQIA